ncbi:DUF1997 domain-containing protein [Gloeocapsa sp. PCC 73106]|uniref:DUF1997 domain-containing protein n=1 Tax=Gloeocapsa sp. PCC 73106 TaxID=102232 RepID=UPI0002ABB6E2|nr:DUF1997 domain-containing protein [Gloeocapsa sp. PCC 73106]ELR98327.1 Protein of unknown function (DUF1997) [Gloeocapsa sp. PCC 73106]
MDVKFTASESVEIRVQQKEIPIQHYLRQPQRLVKAIASPSLMEQLSEERFRLKMSPLNFMEIYHFQPTVVLRVTPGPQGTVYLQSEDCEIRGIDYINDRFSLHVTGKLAPYEINGETYLKGKANLEVKVELPPLLWLTPRPFLEIAGNGLLKSVLLRIKQRLLSHLVQDYSQWAQEDAQVVNTLPESSENLLA